MIEIPFYGQVPRADDSALLVDGGRLPGAVRHHLLMCVFDNEKLSAIKVMVWLELW